MKLKNLTFIIALMMSIVCSAKDIKTVVLTTSPKMTCENCENKIKSNIRFVKGVKDIVTNIPAQTVTIKYDADKTTVEKIVAGFSEINYKATVVNPSECKGEGSCCKQKEESSCCGEKKGSCCKK